MGFAGAGAGAGFFNLFIRRTTMNMQNAIRIKLITYWMNAPYLSVPTPASFAASMDAYYCPSSA